jgi:hypothetical protein
MIQLDSVRTQIKGRMIGPRDVDHADARTVFVGGIDRHPDLIVRPTDAADVADRLESARRIRVRRGTG